MPDGQLAIRHPGERGADATVVLNFDDGAVVEAMDVTFQPPGDLERGLGLLGDLVAAGNLLMDYSKSQGGGPR